MRWIDREIEPGSIFMDVGANIGVYTIAAAHRVGPGGRVYAFEPHKVNAAALMKNLALSRLSERVDVFTCPLSDRPAMVRFNYASLSSASSGSQTGHRRAPGGADEFTPVATEVTAALTVDTLISDGVISPPTHVKIDVDGNELEILRGMQTLLTGQNRPKAVQVEIGRDTGTQIEDFMVNCSYRLDCRLFTKSAEDRRRRGVPIDQIGHNAMFRPA
jgi:FkbM family methyltransferase